MTVAKLADQLLPNASKALKVGRRAMAIGCIIIIAIVGFTLAVAEA